MRCPSALCLRGAYTSLSLDAQRNPRISHYDIADFTRSNIEVLP